MKQTIQRIFIRPSMAIARLGGSTTPQVAFRWVEAQSPRSKGETAVAPYWSLRIRADATVEPFMPDSISFRDGALIRPVCPFLELWAAIGSPDRKASTWRDVPLTPTLLAQSGSSVGQLTFSVDAKNFKAARRTGRKDLQFGTFPALQVTGDNHLPQLILASSPETVPVRRRLIPPGRPVPLGSFQVLRSTKQPSPDANAPWTQIRGGQPLVNVEVIRCRFTPARGHVYGPPTAARPHNAGGRRSFPPVDPSRAYLNPSAGWAGVRVDDAPDAPQDTYDGADVGDERSLGVIDDTCEIRLTITLSLVRARVLRAAANIFVAPPDFAPDRRPFVSVADELNDRMSDAAARTGEMAPQERDSWVQDLFERVFETSSLLNLDQWRRQKSVQLSGDRLGPLIPGDKTRDPARAMGGRDRLRDQSVALPKESAEIKLPLSDRARDRHRALSDLEFLRDFVTQKPGRLRELIRPPFSAEDGETTAGVGVTTMRMPPFMRNSNAGPLTLTAWQYDLLMSWVEAVQAKPARPAALLMPEAAPPSPAAAARRAQVLARLTREGQR